ncbi:winged helix-turn-helix domain-containing protein [Actinomadura barringtoniae]|uniref:Winged helix-turn-helix domain-containing protein n=1 Tax=Actinomadura barringtoniae TaxID=1427535 RepID=A0A939P8C8_9ACTN|nr:BTAD domain-containing putative transcriptional regulator [Actinomadura barringtoniae]MBO2447570.1 winged helix-turn-helix domain-containing protein [Actinomadura barringtoniae]
MLVRVLGATEVTRDGTAVDLGGPLPRRLLCALVMAEGQPVGDDRLVEVLWGDRAPARPEAALQVYVSRLRRALGPQDRGLLERGTAGYRFRLPPQATDAAGFAAGVDEGRRLLAADHPSRGLAVLDEALALWRGEPYADLPDSAETAAVRRRFGELREAAVEERLAALLATGDAPRAVAELEEAVSAAPYRERRWALLVLGLYRCGRQGDALAALRRARSLLADELGVDPGPELRRLERLVFAQDPHLLLPSVNQAPVARPLSSFLGRAEELRTVSGLLAERRLVTLVGPAGVGKTRLAVEYASTGPDVDGLWLVRLADVRQPEVIAQAIADAVGLAQVAGDPLPELVEALAGRAALLVLDNCEHLVDAVAAQVVELLAGCPRLRVLATSREPLRIDGEATVNVAPLAVQEPDGGDGPAMALLFDRVRAVRPGWSPSAEERVQARLLCAALDGIPLALELAAARTRLLGLDEIVQHLDDRFALLGPVQRGSLAPHATLDAAIAWSVNPLPAQDRAMLLRLWPFEGGFPLEAAEETRPQGVSVLESLSTLVTRSVVGADTTASPTRYRLLETIRAYCEAADPDPRATREAHAQWVRGLVSRSAADMAGRRAGRTTRTLARELPNLRAGIDYDLAHHPEEALRTVGLLEWFWVRCGHVAEGRRLLQTAIEAAPGAPHLDHARARLAMVPSGFFATEMTEARRLLDEARTAIGEPSDDGLRSLYGRLRYYTAFIALASGDAGVAHRAGSTAAAVGADLGEDHTLVAGQMTLSTAMIQQGRVGAGEAGLIEAVRRARGQGILWCAGWAELALAQSYLRRRNAEALGVLRRALADFQGEEDTTYGLAVLHHGVQALALAGRPQDAIRLRTAVRRHARLVGPRPEVLRRTSVLELADLLIDLLGDDRDEQDEGAGLSWSAMAELLNS